MDLERERLLVRTFVVPPMRARYLNWLKSRKGRRKFTDALNHFRYFDPRFMTRVEGDLDSREGLLAELRRRGAPEQCYVVSDWSEMDGWMERLEEAIEELFAVGFASLLCCVPGELAYWDSEEIPERYILHRRRRPAR